LDDYAAQDPINGYDLDGTEAIPWRAQLAAVLALGLTGPCLLNPAACNSGSQDIVNKTRDLISRAFSRNTPSPALPESPYSPGSVDSRKSDWRKKLGYLGDPDGEPTLPGSVSKPRTPTPKAKKPHATGERNVNPQEEHSRTPKGNRFNIA
jgi:hypothetical protein